MDKSACHVIYVNRNVDRDRLVHAAPDELPVAPDDVSPDRKHDQVRQNVQPLLDAFGDVHVCATGASCISKLLELQDETLMEMKPTLVLLDTPHDERIPATRSSSRSPSPHSEAPKGAAGIHAPDEELYGLNLLQKLITEAHLRNMSKLVVPVPIISFAQATAGSQMTDGAVEPFSAPLDTLAANRQLVRRCLDLGAVDVIISPLSSKCITTLEICAYKAHRDAAREQQALLEVRRGRKRSWVGVNEQKPFAYLREAMVSGLMNGICRLNTEDVQISGAHIAVSSERQADIAAAVGHWHFSAHAFSDDELLVAAMVMFQHALGMPELERWRLPADHLISFLVTCRAAYNDFVPYHNFRHVVDVLQATFNFLVHIGALPPYPPSGAPSTPPEKSPIAKLLSPFESLTLLITAIGHDVGHPGVNNGFLATLNAPLAQLYNDRSVLESFHCAAYSQILRRYWPTAFEDGKMRNLMISSILATDMGLHFDYMKKLGDVQEKLRDGDSTEGWNERQLEEQRALACALLIKCADISNVARRHDTALLWMHILSEEFSRQASMESELAIKSSLMAPPKKDMVSLSNAQLGFMNLFAIPLFKGVADIMPAMKYTVQELEVNRGRFERMVQEGEAKEESGGGPGTQQPQEEGTPSPEAEGPSASTEESNKGSPSQAESPGQALVVEASEPRGRTPSAVVDVQLRDEQYITPAPTEAMPRSAHNSDASTRLEEVNGTASSFTAVRELADSDPFRCRDGAVAPAPGRQRCSETTDGSASGAMTGDWASQATSATTGKMPISPSTQGTSIVSRESMDRPSSMPGLSVSPPSTTSSPATVKKEGAQADEGSGSTGSVGKAEGKSLKKKPSRFRMKDFPFFRRHKGSGPTYPAADTAG